MHLNAGGTSSGIYSLKDNMKQNTVEVNTVLLDTTLPEILKNSIILIDVEGAEPLVLRGGASFIKRNNPLIIFEYNQTSKKYFHLNDIQEILGKSYSIYRLKNDGDLDQDFSNSWNCVAIPEDSVFEDILMKR